MIRLIVYLGVTAAAVGGGFVVVTGRAALTRTGYRVAQMESERQELVEQNRQLEARIARLKTAAHIVERAASLRIDAVPPEESLRGKEAESPKRR